MDLVAKVRGKGNCICSNLIDCASAISFFDTEPHEPPDNSLIWQQGRSVHDLRVELRSPNHGSN